MTDEFRILEKHLLQMITGGPPVTLKLADFPPEMHKIVDHINRLAGDISEVNEFSYNISRGNLSTPVPSRYNYLASSLKDLHSKMLHLNWQIVQVAKGNYTQSLDYMGEFSDSFNDMLSSVSERERFYQDKLSRIDDERKSVFHSYTLLNTILENIPEVVMVQRNGELLFKNNKARALEDKFLVGNTDKTGIFKYIEEFQSETEKETIEYYDSYIKRWFLVDMTKILWKDELSAFIFLISDITQQKHNERKLQKAAEYDALTKVGNRKLGIRLLNEAIHQKRSFPMCICFIDLDGLKAVNDTYGHSAGDTYLKVFTAQFRKTLPGTDFMSRVGGDEFLIMMKRTDKTMALERIKKIEKTFEEMRSREKYPNTYLFSYGLLEVSEERNSFNVQELIQKADTLMYRQKQEKKNLIDLEKHG